VVSVSSFASDAKLSRSGWPDRTESRQQSHGKVESAWEKWQWTSEWAVWQIGNPRKQKTQFNFTSGNSKTKTRNSPHLVVDDSTHKIETISQIGLIKFEMMIASHHFLTESDQPGIFCQKRFSVHFFSVC
jgi:hypothetical protein